MKRVFKKVFCTLAVIAGVLITSTCNNVGLGESVDTQPPSLAITYPEQNVIIRDSFILAGTCSDETSVKSVTVTVKNTDTGTTYIENAEAQISSDNKSWQITLNNAESADDEKSEAEKEKTYYAGWELPDGKYSVNVIATDKSGKTSDELSRSFDIDNTAPVFVISNPGVVKNGTTSPSAYGSIFTIEGSIAELHSVSSMDVTIYDASGAIVSKETYDGEEIDAFRETDVETKGSTNITIAQSTSNDESLKSRYSAVYGDTTSGTAYYTCKIVLTDNAQVYQTPDSTADARTASEQKSDSAGNSTAKLYLNDDIYSSLLSQKQESSAKLKVSDLMNILNGTSSLDSSVITNAASILSAKVKNTADDADSSKLYFSLNPEANPTYNITGYSYDFNDSSNLTQASSGQTVSVSVSSGLDGTNIDLDGTSGKNYTDTVKVWMREYEESPSETDLASAIEALVKAVLDEEDSQFENETTDNFIEYSNATAENPVTSFNDFKLIYDYGQHDTDTDEGSVSSKTFGITLPENSISLKKYYILVVTGADVDDVVFSQSSIYGFEGNEAGVAPTLKITSPANSSLKDSSEFSFEGSATLSSGSLFANSLAVTLTVTDQSTDTTVGTATRTITRSAKAEEWSTTDAFTCGTDGNWTLDITKLSEYETIKAENASGKNYVYTLELAGKSSSGHEDSKTSMVQVDSILPVIEISSITPTVDGSEYDSSGNTYVNGTVTVKGTVEETNLESVSMQIFVDGSAVAYWVDDDGNKTDTLNLGKVYSFSQSIDTTELTDEKSLDIRVTATDKVGNSKTYSSLSASGSDYSKLQILQETDRPVITLNNASNSSETDSENQTFDFVTDSTNINANNGNLFGTVSNNKISVSVSDDDLIKSVEMIVYEKDGTTVVDSTAKTNIGKSTYSNSFILPAEEGVYIVEVIATDDVLSTELSGRTPVSSTTGKFYIAVSAGAPAISVDTLSTYQTPKPTITGTVGASATAVTATFIDVSTEKELASGEQPATVTVTKIGTTWKASPDKELSDSSYKILFTAKDSYGQSSSTTATFTVDNEVPTITVTQYGSNQFSDGLSETTEFYTNASTVNTIKGSASDAVSKVAGVFYYVGDIPEGKETPSTENGWYSANLGAADSAETSWTLNLSDLGSLTENSTYVVHIMATDNAGNSSADNNYVNLVIDSTAPVTVLNGTALFDADGNSVSTLSSSGTYYAKESFTLSGTITEVNLDSIKINGTAVTVTENTWTYSPSITADGTYTYKILLTDKALNQSEYNVTVICDTTAPSIAVTSPVADSNTTTGSLTLEGNVSDTGSGLKQISYVITEVTDSSDKTDLTGSKIISDSGNWTIENVSLTKEGTYTLTVTASDILGNKKSAGAITFYYDKTEPVLKASISDTKLFEYTKDNVTYSVYGSTTFNVKADASDTVSGVASVVANSTATLVKGEDGSYTGKVIASLNEYGTTSINIAASDKFGNSATTTISNIMVDVTPPVLAVTDYPENSTKSEFTLSGTVSDNLGVKTVVVTDSLDSSKSYAADVSDGKWTIELTPSSTASGTNETKDGVHTYTVTATDVAENTSTATCRVTTDTTAPYWYTGNTSDNPPYVSTKASSDKITISGVEYSMYNSTSVTIAAKAKDATTSVSALLYNLNDRKNDSDEFNWTEAENGNISLENLKQGVNTIKIKARDEAENETSYLTLSFFVDSLAPAEPTLKSVGSDSDSSSMADFAAQNKQKLVNGKTDLTFTVSVADTTTGGADTYSGISSVKLTKIGNAEKSIVGTLTSTNTDDGTTVYSITIPAEQLASGSATVTVTDKAGNSTSLGMFNLVLDNKAPTVTLSAPADADTSTADKRDVNKTISLTGSATDNQTTDSFAVSLEYSTDNSTWTTLTTEKAGSSYKVEWNSGIIASGIDTTNFTDKSTVYIRASATDDAGNTGYSDSLTLYVNQDSDRPIVKISNLTKLSDETFILKYGKDAQVTGTVSDDDSTTSAVVEKLVISESPYDGSGDATNRAEFDKATGDFTFTPASPDDGKKIFYIYIKDNGGNEFYTTAATGTDSDGAATYLLNPKLYLKTDPLDDSLCVKEFTYKSDSTSPKVNNVEGKLSASSVTERSAYSGISVSFVAGGDESSLNLKVTASDANGIAGLLLDITDTSKNTLFKRATAAKIAENSIESSATETDGNFTITSDSSENSVITSAAKYYVNSSDIRETGETTYTWEPASAIDLSNVPTGALTITVTAYDNSGLSGNGSYTFMVDNSGPSVKMTSPSSSTTVSGSSINVSGTTAEVGSSSVESIQYLIPTTSQVLLSDSALSELETWAGVLSSVSTASSWTFIFNGTDNALLSNYTKDTTYATADTDGVYTLPVYFKATDAIGNYTICRDYSIRYNPDADRPVTQITYPDSSILTSDGYAVLGGKIRVTGTVEIPSGDSTAYQVYLQVSDNDGGFDEDDKDTVSGTYGFTVLDADELENAWKNAQGSTSSLNFSNDSTVNTEKKNAWWGIPATLYSSKTSWYIVINNDDKMNAESGTNDVKIRVCGVGENGKVGLWSDSYSIHIDSQVPRYSDSPLLYHYADTLSSGDAFYSATPSSAQSYSAGVYLKGQWYLCTSVTDETYVKINGVSLGSSKLTSGTDYFVYPSAADNSSGSADGSEVTDSGRYIAYVYIKIDTDKTSTQSYTITAEDSDANGSNTSTATFEVNADNVAPVFAVNANSKPVITDGNDSEISMTKLKNSDHVVTFGSTATDSGSGFERIAFYFKRTADSTTTVELPIPLANGSAWENSSSSAYVGEVTDTGALQTDKDLTDTVDTNYSTNALYGVTLSGSSSVDSTANTTTFTSSADISSYKFIRAGGIIKLSGIYYTIVSVSGNAITVDGSVSTLPATAFAPAALIADNTSSEVPGTWSSGFVISGDDGDGIIESVKKSGSTWTWDVSLYLDELEDGPVTLVTMAFDKAGNVRTLETPVMIANNTPRLAKVYLATDLNGDGKFTDNELGSSTMADTNESQKFYSALTNGTSGRVQEVVTIENADGSGTTGITMRNDLGLAFEFVSGYEGYGSGNGTLSYKLAVGDTALTTATSGTDGQLTTATDSTYDTTASTTTAGIVTNELKGFTIPTGKFKYGSNTTGFEYNEWASASGSDNKINYIGVTLWDSTKGTTAGTGDTVDSDENITAFGSQWTVVNVPLYIDLVDDQFPVPAIKDPTADRSTGHVDLSSTLPSANFAGTSGEFDTDTKISGTVVFTGTVTDEKRVESIYLTTSSKFSSTEVSSVKVASYNTSTGGFTVSQPATGLTFAITDNEFSTESGHTVGWSLTVDTSAVESVAAADVTFTVAASDGTNTNASSQTVEPAAYRTDIVPYITGIVRSQTTKSNTTMNRSTYGEYPVAVCDTLKVSGWNFGTSPIVNVGTKSATASNADGTSFTIGAPANSGELTVTVNEIVSLNDKNNNAEETNLDTDDKFDNRYIRVWDVGHYFSQSSSGNEPTMITDMTGNLFSSWTVMGSGTVQLQRNLSSSTTDYAQKPSYAGYDQPDKITAFAVDNSSNNNGGLSVLFLPANVGNGGKVTNIGYANGKNIGGAWGQGIDNKLNNITATFGTTKTVSITDNPTHAIDSTTNVAGFQLASYAMGREVSVFDVPRTARFGNVLHYTYYDSANKALRYSCIDMDNYSLNTTSNAYRYNVDGWTLIDGASTGIDRLHEKVVNKSGTVVTDTDIFSTNSTKIDSSSSSGAQDFSSLVATVNAVTTSDSVTTQSATVNAVTTSDSVTTQSATVNAVTTSDSVTTQSATVNAVTTSDSVTTQSATVNAVTTSDSVTTQSATVSMNKQTAMENAYLTNGITIALMYTDDSGNFKYDLHDLSTAPVYRNDSYTFTWNTSDSGETATGFSRYTIAIYFGAKNIVSEGTSSTSAGKYQSLALTSRGKPVIVYYDADNEQLKIAYCNTANGAIALTWTRQTISGVSGGTYVQAKIDGNNYLHIMYRDSDGKLCYLKSTNAPDGAAYTFDKPMTIDSSGTYGTLSVMNTGTAENPVYVPCVSWLNSEGTANGVKYAHLRDVDTGDGNTESLWDVQIVPAVVDGGNHYVTGGELVYVEGKSGSWNTTEDSVSMGDCDSVVGFNTGRMDVVFLKSEK